MTGAATLTRATKVAQQCLIPPAARDGLKNLVKFKLTAYQDGIKQELLARLELVVCQSTI